MKLKVFNIFFVLCLLGFGLSGAEMSLLWLQRSIYFFLMDWLKLEIHFFFFLILTFNILFRGPEGPKKFDNFWGSSPNYKKENKTKQNKNLTNWA